MNKISKTKVLAIAGVLGLGALALGAGTLAYFNDKDTATNVFTSGKVDIALNEYDHAGNKITPNTVLKLIPGSNEANVVGKNATVTVEEGSETSWVWVELLIPTELYNSQDQEHETNNALHYNQFFDYIDIYENFTPTTTQQTAGCTAANVEVITGRSCNSHAIALRDNATYAADLHQWSVIKYIDQYTDPTTGTVYARLRTIHKDPVTAGKTTSPAVNQFYMDDSVYFDNDTNKYMIPEDGAANNDRTTGKYTGDFVPYDGDWKVIINAYAVQASGLTIEQAIQSMN